MIEGIAIPIILTTAPNQPSVLSPTPKATLRAVTPGTAKLTATISVKSSSVMKTADGEVVTFSPFCPHARANLLHGRFENDTVTCHWHGWTFDLPSGAGTNNDSCLSVFPVEVKAGVVYLLAENQEAEQPDEDYFMPEIKWKKDSDD